MEWNKTIQEALWLYINREGITYCLGCSGEVVGRDKNVENQFKYYYNHDWKNKIGQGLEGWNENMNADQAWALWSNKHKGKMAFDCSGLLCFCIGYKGVHKYTSWDFQKMKANESCAAGVAGSALWKKGHVALDIGYGYLLEIGEYNKTIELNKISQRAFTSSHLINEIDYTGATER